MNMDVKWNGGLNFEAMTPSGVLVQMDSPSEGAAVKGGSPMELILHAGATCSGIDIVMILEKRRKELKSFNVKVESDRSDTHPRVFTRIKFIYQLESDNLTIEEANKAAELSIDKYCSVLGMLKDSVKIEWECELV